MPDIFDEVEEEYRAERARKVWQRYSAVIGLAALLVLGGIAGWQGYAWWQQRQTEAAARTYLTIENAEGLPPAERAAQQAALAAEAPAGYRTLARLRQAGLLAQAGEAAAAREALDQLARDTGAEPLYRDLASLLWVMHGLGSEDPAALAARLAPLTAEGNAWRASAQELAGLVELRRNNAAEARRVFERLAGDEAAPRGVRERAQRLARSIEG